MKLLNILEDNQLINTNEYYNKCKTIFEVLLQEISDKEIIGYEIIDNSVLEKTIKIVNNDGKIEELKLERELNKSHNISEIRIYNMESCITMKYKSFEISLGKKEPYHYEFINTRIINKDNNEMIEVNINYKDRKWNNIIETVRTVSINNVDKAVDEISNAPATIQKIKQRRALYC